MNKLFLLLAAVLIPNLAMAEEDRTLTAITGVAGGILVHEGGHALTVWSLGGDVQRFRPFPSRIEVQNPDGTTKKVWVGGYVMRGPIGEENSKTRKLSNALVPAMGSVTNALAVLIFAPMLPGMKPNFATSSFNQMLVFGSLDWPAYALGDALFSNSPLGDWKAVARATGVSIYWYVAAAISSAVLLNRYLDHFQNEAVDRGTLPSSQAQVSTIGLNFSFE